MKIDGQTFIDPIYIDEYSDEQMVVIQVDAKAGKVLYNAINREE